MVGYLGHFGSGFPLGKANPKPAAHRAVGIVWKQENLHMDWVSANLQVRLGIELQRISVDFGSNEMVQLPCVDVMWTEVTKTRYP